MLSLVTVLSLLEGTLGVFSGNIVKFADSFNEFGANSSGVLLASGGALLRDRRLRWDGQYGNG
jgi:hypothetical protein